MKSRMFDWTRLKRRRSITLLAPRLMPYLAPGRSKLRVSDDSDTLDAAPPLLVRWPDHVPRPRLGLVQDIDSNPYWTKYRRFLDDNGFTVRMVDIHVSEWMGQLTDVDLLVWRPSSQLYELDEARKKIFFLQEFLGLQTYPSLRTVNLYEDKMLQAWALDLLDVDTPITVASYSEADALNGISDLGSEVVWKLATGSGSFGVERMSSPKARAAIHRVFSAGGRRTYWPYLKQKGYAYVQRLEPDLRVDTRIIVVGPLLFGYYRDVPPGDFRASGMGRVRMGALSPEVMEEAWDVARRLDVGAVAVDFIASEDGKKRKVIEFSSFIKVDTPSQLVVDGISGVYVRESAGSFEFRPGHFWLQELALADALGRFAGLDRDRLLLDVVEDSGRSVTP